MKNTFSNLTAIVVITAVSGLAFINIKPGSITGKITPPDAVKEVWAISAKDTVSAIVMQGGFTVAVTRPGIYKIVINAIEPYKNAVKEGINVTEGQPVDVGEIKLQK